MIPVDFQSQPAKDRSERNVADHVSNVMARGGQLPDPEMLRRATDILNQAEKPFIRYKVKVLVSNGGRCENGMAGSLAGQRQ